MLDEFEFGTCLHDTHLPHGRFRVLDGSFLQGLLSLLPDLGCPVEETAAMGEGKTQAEYH